MNEDQLVRRRSEEWRRAELIVGKLESAPKKMSESNVSEFLRFYRRLSTDLALVRTRSQNLPLIDYINSIVAKAHAMLYRTPRNRNWSLESVLAHAVVAFRRNKAFFWAAFGLFFASGIAFYFLCLQNQDLVTTVSGPMADSFDMWTQNDGHEVKGTEEGILATGMYAGNNPRVSIIAGAVGAGTGGLLSVYMLIQNGLIIGALASEMTRVQKLPFLLSSLIPHGVPEMMGIIFAGAAGLKFGWALLSPGLHSRTDSLRRAGRDALIFILIGVILCFIAAPIEGFFSFNGAFPQELKVLAGVVGLAFWVSFWTFAFKGAENDPKYWPEHERLEHLERQASAPR